VSTTRIDAAGRRGGYRIVDALNAEWGRLVGGEDRGIVAGWSARHQALAGCVDLDDVLGVLSRMPDPVLTVLLLEGRRGEVLAGRVILQAMLGKIIRMAERDRHARVDDYVAAMWCRIATYPLEARPARIAANLALDTLKTVTGESRWGTRVTVTLYPPFDADLDDLHTMNRTREELDHNGDLAALTSERILASAARLGLIDSRLRGILSAVYADGLSGKAAAERHRTSPGVVRVSCSRAVRMLAKHADSLVEAA
jgi:DNA-directed RNA polymerase specialized sigma24 family protein